MVVVPGDVVVVQRSRATFFVCAVLVTVTMLATACKVEPRGVYCYEVVALDRSMLGSGDNPIAVIRDRMSGKLYTLSIRDSKGLRPGQLVPVTVWNSGTITLADSNVCKDVE